MESWYLKYVNERKEKFPFKCKCVSVSSAVCIKGTITKVNYFQKVKWREEAAERAEF